MVYYFIATLVIIVLVVGTWFYKRIGSNSQNIESYTAIFDEELWSIREMNNEEALLSQHHTQINTSKELNNTILTLLKQIPQKASKIVKKQERTYLLTFSEKTALAMKEGKLELMQAKGSLNDFRAQAMNHKGNIVEQGVLKPSKVRKINPTQLAMGVLTTVTAQEHLQQIGSQLNTLNSSINKVISAINNRQIGNDKGNIDYLQTVYKGLNEGDVTNNNVQVYREQLETIIRTTMQDLSTVEEGFPNLVNQLENEKLKGLWGANKETENITVIINDYEKQCNIYLSKLDVILVCLSLSKYLDPNFSADVSRLDYIQKKLLDIEKTKEVFFNKVEDIVPEIGARIRFKREKYNISLQERVEKQAIELRRYFDNHKERYEMRIKKTKNGKFFDDIFRNGSAEYEITLDDKQTIKSLKKIEKID